MALPSSGPISIEDIQAEFGGGNPASLSEYYGVAAGVPASGAISIEDFYGASNAVDLKLLVDSGKGGDSMPGDNNPGGYGCRSAWNGTISGGTVLTCAAGSAGTRGENWAGTAPTGGGGGGGSGVWAGSAANILCAAGGGGGCGAWPFNQIGLDFRNDAGRGYANAKGGDVVLVGTSFQEHPYSRDSRPAGGGNNGAGGLGGRYSKSSYGYNGANWATGNGGNGHGTAVISGGNNGTSYMRGGWGTYVVGDWGGSGGGGGYGGGGGGGHNGVGAGAGAAGGGVGRSVAAVGATYTSSSGASNADYINGAVRVYVSGVLVKTQGAGGTSNHTV